MDDPYIDNTTERHQMAKTDKELLEEAQAMIGEQNALNWRPLSDFECAAFKLFVEARISIEFDGDEVVTDNEFAEYMKDDPIKNTARAIFRAVIGRGS